MKELERTTTRTITETKTVYVAQDGAEFSDKEQCEKYEASAIFACHARLNMKKVKQGNRNSDSKAEEKLYWACTAFNELFDCGCDADLYSWSPKSEEEIKTFVQWWELVTGERPLTRKEIASKWAKWYTNCPDELEVGTEYFIAHERDCDCIRVIDRTTLGAALEGILDTISNDAWE